MLIFSFLALGTNCTSFQLTPNYTSFQHSSPPSFVTTNPAHTPAMGRIPWAKILLFELLFTIVLYPTRDYIYRVPVLTALIYTTVQFFLEPEASAYILGGRITQRVLFTAYLLFVEGPFPDHWRRIRDEVRAEADQDGLDNMPSNFPFTKKLWWMLDLSYSIRMVGWVQEPRDCLPPHPPPSRLTFLWKTSLKFITVRNHAH